MLCAFSAVITAFAISGMHFSGMAAAKYVIVDHRKNNVALVKHIISSDNAMTGALAASAMILFGITSLSIADLRAWFYNQSSTSHRVELMIKQIEKSPNHTSTNSNLLPKIRTIVNRNSSMHSKVSEDVTN
jgi:hypothetical protein